MKIHKHRSSVIYNTLLTYVKCAQHFRDESQHDFCFAVRKLYMLNNTVTLIFAHTSTQWVWCPSVSCACGLYWHLIISRHARVRYFCSQFQISTEVRFWPIHTLVMWNFTSNFWNKIYIILITWSSVINAEVFLYNLTCTRRLMIPLSILSTCKWLNVFFC